MGSTLSGGLCSLIASHLLCSLIAAHWGRSRHLPGAGYTATGTSGLQRKPHHQDKPPHPCTSDAGTRNSSGTAGSSGQGSVMSAPARLRCETTLRSGSPVSARGRPRVTTRSCRKLSGLKRHPPSLTDGGDPQEGQQCSPMSDGQD